MDRYHWKCHWLHFLHVSDMMILNNLQEVINCFNTLGRKDFLLLGKKRIFFFGICDSECLRQDLTSNLQLGTLTNVDMEFSKLFNTAL